MTPFDVKVKKLKGKAIFTFNAKMVFDQYFGKHWALTRSILFLAIDNPIDFGANIDLLSQNSFKTIISAHEASNFIRSIGLLQYMNPFDFLVEDSKVNVTFCLVCQNGFQ
jgi:hypothetical protein